MQKVYATERLYLKVLDKSYAQLVLDYYLRNMSFLKEWEPEKSKDFYTLKYQEEQLDKELSDINNKRIFKLWIFKKEDSSRVIGSICFSNIVFGPFLS